MSQGRQGEVSPSLEALRAENQELREECARYRELYHATLEQCRKLELGFRGQTSERLSSHSHGAQLTMAVLGALLGDEPESQKEPEPEPETRPVKPHRRRRPTGRKPLPEHLPRVEIEVLPEDVKRKGLDAFERIGEEVSETIERRPSAIVVVRAIRPKFVHKDEVRASQESTEVRIAEPLELPIERGLAGPGMLADTVVRRWEDHLPAHRLEKIYAREGLDLARSTICGWHFRLADLVEPLVTAMWADAFEAPYLCTDATGVLVQAKEKCRYSHFWVVVAPERHVLFAYSRKHDSAAVDRILSGYRGYLVADAHSVYDHLYVGGDIVEVACWAHARRYFFKALDSEPDLARAALAWIGGLFRLERSLATAPRKKREAARQKRARPIVEQFYRWCDAQADTVVDHTPIARAIRYARNQREALQRFLDDGRLPLHNNISEGALRRQAVGRKNWLFVGSDDGGEVNARFVTLLASCRMHGLEPWSYLRDLFCLLPSWPHHRVLELAPASWQQTLENEHARERLAANPFRQITLNSSV